MSSTLIDADAAKLAGLQIDLLQKYRKGHVTLDHLEWFLGLTKAERDEYCADGTGSPEPKTAPSTLRLISEGKDITLPETKAWWIWEAKDVFAAYRDPIFKRLKGGATAPETKCSVYEMVRDATLRQMFGSINDEPRKLALTQGQIVQFCETHRDWLHPSGYATLFLFEEDDDLFVASVRVRSAGLRVSCPPFAYGDVWFAGYRYRVVVPQL